jgi:hypothetical protein
VAKRRLLEWLSWKVLSIPNHGGKRMEIVELSREELRERK